MRIEMKYDQKWYAFVHRVIENEMIVVVFFVKETKQSEKSWCILMKINTIRFRESGLKLVENFLEIEEGEGMKWVMAKVTEAVCFFLFFDVMQTNFN